MWKLIELDKDMSNYFTKWLDYFQYFDELYREKRINCLSTNCFATTNLLKCFKEETFCKNLEYLKSCCEDSILNPLEYYHVHMVDYTNGGNMRIHKHEHNEDYSFVLYLNNCDDGETVLMSNPPATISPQKNKILVFSSNLYHYSKFSKSKKILVGGLKSK